MTDIKDKHSGGNGPGVALFHDEQDGTYSEAVAGHLRGWDTSDLGWNRIPVDHATGALKSTLTVGTVVIGQVDQGLPGASPWKVTDPALADGSQRVGGTVAVTIAALPLPSGAATETTLGGVKTGTDKIPSGLTVTSTRLLVDGSGVTQPVSAASLPLPAGAATDAVFQAAVGIAGLDAPAAATVLARLISIERAIKTQGEATIAALQSAPAVKRRPATLLHRS